MAKRGRKPGSARKGYFYEKEESALVEYLNSDDQAEKDKIFRTILLPAFTKMIESIIRRYNLYTPDEEFKETFDDTISFLMSKINHFNPESGYKAYSYCGTICKNYLICKINKYNRDLKRNERYDLLQTDIDDNIKYAYNDHSNRIKALNELIANTAEEIQGILDDGDAFQLKPNEIKVGMALIDLLHNWEDLFARMGSNKFNKSSILLFLKETTYLTTPEIRDGMKKYKELYKELKKRIMSDIYN